MASEPASGNNELAKQNVEVNHEDGNTPEEAARCSVSSASSTSSREGDKSTLYNSPVISEFDGNGSSSHESLRDMQNEPVTPQWSMLSQSPTPEQMRSPGMMGLIPGYDPNRIPSHIFSTKPSNQGEWSTASNESLFSIHMGNNSFTSGEPFWLEEWNNSQQNSLQNGSDFRPSQANTLPPVMEVSAHEENSVISSANSVQDHKLERENSDKSFMEEKMSPPEIVPASTVVPSMKCAPPVDTSRNNSSNNHSFSASNARLSDESRNSSSSFAFPVLVHDGSKPAPFKTTPSHVEKPGKSELQTQESSTSAKPSEARWYSCLCNWPRCC